MVCGSILFALGPYGGLISGYRNQHAEPDLIVQTHRLLQRVDVLRLVHVSAMSLTGRRTRPSILSGPTQRHRVSGQAGCPATVIIAQVGQFGKPFHAHRYWVGRHSPAPPQKDVPPSPTAKTAGIIYHVGLPGRVYEAYTRSIFEERHQNRGFRASRLFPTHIAYRHKIKGCCRQCGNTLPIPLAHNPIFLRVSIHSPLYGA